MGTELSAFIKHRRWINKLIQEDSAYKAEVGLRFSRNLEQGKPRSVPIK